MIGSRLTISLLALGIIVFFPPARAQQVEVGTSTIHDENIFDIYAPTSDQVTQLQAGISDDWDADPFTFSLAYNGAFLLFNNVTARNYHVHVVTFDLLYETPEGEGEDPEDEGVQGEADTSDAPAGG